MTSFEPEAISSQVENIVMSTEFSGGRRLTQLLRYLIRKKLNNQEDNLKQYTIAVEALGYHETFDPQSNPAVRILARRLRRALNTYYANEGQDDEILINIPIGTYVPLIAAKKETGSQRVRDGKTIGGSSELNAVSGKPLSLSIGVVLFRSLHDSNDLDYFGSGITEELIISLTRFTNFRVVGPLFRMVFKEKGLDIDGIRKTYDVRFILEGTVRQRDDSLHITVKLIDTISGGNIWGDKIVCDRRGEKLAACEEHIVASVASTVGDNFGVINSVLSKEIIANNTRGPSSLEAMLRFYHYMMHLTEQSYVNALNALENAIKEDKEDAFCHAALGDLLIASWFVGYDVSEEFLNRAEELGRKAVAMDPSCQQAHFTMVMLYFARRQIQQFFNEASEVLRINPRNANLVAALGMHFWMVGERDQGKQLMDKAKALNPHHPGWYYMVQYCHHYSKGEFALALSYAQKINTPELYIDPLFRAAAHGQLNNNTGGQAALKELLMLFPEFRSRGREIVKRLFYLDEHIDMLWEGLNKAGIET